MPKAMSVLLVEKDDVEATAVRWAFRDLGVAHTLTRAPDVNTALSYLQDESANKPNLILLGLSTSNERSTEFLKTVKLDDKTKSIPVVALAATHDEAMVAEYFDLGVAGYIKKPVDYKELLETLDKIDHYWSLNTLPSGD
jgi:CheY-like chemotaxis protein